MLHAGVYGARKHEVPRYIEMPVFVCDQLKWKIKYFDIYRVRVDYRLYHTRIWTPFAALP